MGQAVEVPGTAMSNTLSEVPKNKLLELPVAEEMQIKPTVLKKAMRTAYKAEFEKVTDEYSEMENILATVGKI